MASFWYQTERLPQIAMRLPSECYQMRQTIQHHMPHLRRSQIDGLTLWVYGTIVGGSGCQNVVVCALSFVAGFHTMRQYLREWLYDGQDCGNRYVLWDGIRTSDSPSTPCSVLMGEPVCGLGILRQGLVMHISDTEPPSESRAYVVVER